MNNIPEFMVLLYCCMIPGCDKAYSTKFNIKRHIETIHLKKKRHQCTICYRWFASKQNLSEHTNLHTGAKPFSCPICGKLFRQVSQLSLHKRKHDSEPKQLEATEHTILIEEQEPRIILSDISKKQLDLFSLDMDLKIELPPLRPNEDKSKK